MKKIKRNILALAGIASTILGIIVAIPSFLQEKYVFATVSSIMIICGLVLLAIAFGD